MNEYHIDDNVIVWKYMNLSKFLSLLTTQSLFFCRADKFDDIHEGSFNKNSIKEYEKHVGLTFNNGDIFKLIPQHTFVSCWHMSSHESVAMWKIYGGGSESVAIQSSVKSLRLSFPSQSNYDNDNSKFIHQAILPVKYSDSCSLHFLMGPLSCKKPAYSYENELRMIRAEFPSKDEIIGFVRHPRDIPPFYSLKIDFNQLMHGIYLAPQAPAYLKDVINNLLQRYNVNSQCYQSSLDDLPEFSFRNK